MAPRWIDLAQGYQPSQNRLMPSESQSQRGPGAEIPMRLLHNAGRAGLRIDLTDVDWDLKKSVDALATLLPLRPSPDNRSGGRSVHVNGVALYDQSAKGSKTQKPAGADAFALRGEWLYVEIQDLATEPDEIVFTYEPKRGELDVNAWAIAGRRFSGHGLSLWSGESVGRVVMLGQAAQLRFAITGERMLKLPDDAPEPRVEFCIRINGETIFEHSLSLPRDGAMSWHQVSLPASLGGTELGTELVFSVTGDLAYTAFLSPVITNGPSVEANPDLRPDVIVLQVDTLRADSLLAYGAEEQVAPNLDAFLAESLVFERSWSVGTYTLPAHATMMSGVYPRQAGIEDEYSRMGSKINTVAEVMGAAGYRTAAITDGGFVSQLHGLQQGFHWFEEHQRDFSFTSERVLDFLDRDDGRPTFLFIQTYAVHTPYDISLETQDRFGIGMTFEELSELGKANGFTATLWRNDEQALEALEPPKREFLNSFAQQMRQLYMANIYDFDLLVGAFRENLLRRGVFDPGYLVLVSDHGESFLRHHSLFHANIPYDEELHIPFVVHGAGVSPGVNSTPVSLIDLAPTITGLAGVSAPAAWLGHSVMGEIPDRNLYAFQCSQRSASTWAQIDGNRKWIGYETQAGVVSMDAFRAFDLGLDPLEQIDVLHSADWAQRLSDESADIRDWYFTPLFESETSGTSQEHEDKMSALGYGD